jgi:hypothetical protein
MTTVKTRQRPAKYCIERTERNMATMVRICAEMSNGSLKGLHDKHVEHQKCKSIHQKTANSAVAGWDNDFGLHANATVVGIRHFHKIDCVEWREDTVLLVPVGERLL